jgi:protein-disulfide isomerase
MGRGEKDRAAAKRIVQQQRAAEKRRAVTLWTSVAVVAVLLIAGLIGWGALAGQDGDTTVATPPGAVDGGTAFAAGDGPVRIDIYEDFMCPACGRFESESATTLQRLIADRKVTVQYHPIAILDRFSNGTEYSTRAAAASAAAGAAGKFTEFHRVLFANRPAEGSNGLDDAKLIELGRSAGLTDASFADAVNDGTYTGWARKVTETASERGVTGTPTVLVAGQKLDSPTAAALERAVAAAAG